ncbi:MAG: DUF4376 domain-containing protein [Burkholderiales bacterium]
MKTFAIYTHATGDIIQTASCPDEDIQAFADSMGAMWLEIGAGAALAQSVVIDGELVDLGQAPSTFHRIVSGAWVDPRTIADLRAAKWVAIKVDRARAEAAPLVVAGCTFDAGPTSQQRIAGAVQLALIGGAAFSIDWTLADNTVTTLSAPEMVAVGLALGAQVSAAHERARTLRTAIEAATTAAEVEAVVW